MNAAPEPLRAGFYETFRTSGGRLHHWRFNAVRLAAACAQVGFALPASFLGADEARLQQSVAQLLAADRLDDAVFRYAIALDPAPTETLAVRPLPAPPPPGGIALRVLRVAREPAMAQPRPKISDHPTIAAATAELQTRATAPSDEGLLLGRDTGEIVETTRQNVLWIADGRLHYPAPALGPVAGTCLAWLLASGFAAVPARVPLAALVSAEAVAVCNSVRGITPVCELWDAADRHQLHTYDSATHPLIVGLAAAWHAALARTAGNPP